MAYKKLTNDQICQLKAQAGDEATKLIDELIAAAEAAAPIVDAELPEEAGTYYMTVTIAEDEEPVYAWAALPE